MNIGFRILPVRNKPDKITIKKFESVVTPFISDNMNRLNSVNSSIRPFHKYAKLTGPAITIKTRAGDNLMVHKALEMAEEGDVVIVDAGGDMTNAILGEIIKKIAEKKGIAGFVIDGAIRDSKAFAEDVFPVYAKGVTNRGPFKDGPGEINVPVAIGGTVVFPGDIIVGDEDGLVVVPLEEAEYILQKARQQKKQEEETFKQINNGTIDRSWINKTLEEKGCEIHEL